MYVLCLPTSDFQEVPPRWGRPKFLCGPVRNIPHKRWGEVKCGELARGGGGGGGHEGGASGCQSMIARQGPAFQPMCSQA